jgi:hypothetical protein
MAILQASMLGPTIIPTIIKNRAILKLPAVSITLLSLGL